MPLSHVQPEHYDALLATKVGHVTRAIREFSPPEPTIYASQPTGYRQRAEFRMHCVAGKLGYVMFRREDPKTPVEVTDFPIAAEPIQRTMPVLLTSLNASPNLGDKLFQVEFLATLSGEMVVTLVYHKHLDQDWEHAAHQMLNTLHRSFPGISVIGRSRKQKVVLGREYVQEILPILGRNFLFRQYEQSFSQPNAQVNIRMIEWACRQAACMSGDLLELYCGNGNFTLPLAQYFENVIATETSKMSVRAAQANILENDVKNVHVIRLSAEEVSQAMAARRIFRRLSVLPRPLAEFNLRTLFVDPPRAGLDALTTTMAAGFPTIIYLSCNPGSLVRNLQSLDVTHRIERFAVFDQFPYTDHVECGVVLKSRNMLDQ